MSITVRDLGRCAYAEGLALQEEIVARKLRGEEDDQLLLVEHEPVYTLGRGAAEAELCGAGERLGVPVFRVGRGGGVTFHGPGQLVAYPILTLPPGRRDVRRYVADLEAVLLGVCADFGIAATASGPHPGVWVDGRKLAAIGIGVRRWVTWHGVALNVTTDVRYFDEIVPCRVPGMAATSLARELAVPPAMDAVRASLVRRMRERFEGDAAAARASSVPMEEALCP